MIQSANGPMAWNIELTSNGQSMDAFKGVPPLGEALSGPTEAILNRCVDVLNDGNATQQSVANALADLANVCEQIRGVVNAEQWQAFRAWFRHHPVHELLTQDPISQSGWVAARNAGTPARLLDHMFSIEHGWATAEMTQVGRRIHNWTIHQSLCSEVRERRDAFAKMIDQVAAEKNNADVMAYAAGHLREAELATSLIRRKLGRLLVVDPDPDHLALIQRDYGSLGLSMSCQSEAELIGNSQDLGSFDLIYSPSLCDDNPDQIAKELIASLFRQLKPQGKLLLSSYTERDRWGGFREVVMNWDIQYRNRFKIHALTAGIHDRDLRSIRCDASPGHLTQYLLLERTK